MLLTLREGWLLPELEMGDSTMIRGAERFTGWHSAENLAVEADTPDCLDAFITRGETTNGSWPGCSPRSRR